MMIAYVGQWPEQAGCSSTSADAKPVEGTYIKSESDQLGFESSWILELGSKALSPHADFNAIGEY